MPIKTGALYFSVADSGGGAPLRVPILSFWHTDFMERCCVGTCESAAIYSAMCTHFPPRWYHITFSRLAMLLAMLFSFFLEYSSQLTISSNLHCTSLNVSNCCSSYQSWIFQLYLSCDHHVEDGWQQTAEFPLKSDKYLRLYNTNIFSSLIHVCCP